MAAIVAAWLAPTVAATSQMSSVTKDGVTWTFSQAVPVGQFINGDYYVVGPVTVTSISPQPQTASPYKNGSVLNLPKADGFSGFDQRLNDGVDESGWFNPAHRVYTPISLKAGDTLVSSVSIGTIHTLPEFFGSSSEFNFSPVTSVSILTVLSAEPPADAFRPSYCDRSQTIYRGNSIQRSDLPSLAPPSSSLATAMPSMLSQFLISQITLSSMGSISTVA
jgi:hypothetical protein